MGRTAPVKRWARYEPLDVESQRPEVTLTDPDPHTARRWVRDLARSSQLSDRSREDLVSAVSEIVTNAHSHGTGTVRLDAWTSEGGVVVTVSDEGRGPPGADVGDRPADRGPGEGGLGLWLARHLCDEVVLGALDPGFVVRLRARPTRG